MALPREFVHHYSMSSLHMPVSMTEYAIRREKFGEGKLCVRREGLLGDSAGQKYRHLQTQVVDEFFARPRAISEPPVERKLKPCTPSAATLTPGEGLRNPPSTIHGNLGTGNTLSHEFPLRKNMLKEGTIVSRLCERVTTEERRILRALVQFAVRNTPKVDRIELENTVIAALLESQPLKMKFFHDEAFAMKMLEKMCHGKAAAPATQSSSSITSHEPQRTDTLKAPNQHNPDCGPNCFCLKYQDAALSTVARCRANPRPANTSGTWAYQSGVTEGQKRLLNEGKRIAHGK